MYSNIFASFMYTK